MIIIGAESLWLLESKTKDLSSGPWDTTKNIRLHHDGAALARQNRKFITCSQRARFDVCSLQQSSERRERRKNEAQRRLVHTQILAMQQPLLPASIFIDSCFIYIYFPTQDFSPSRLAKSTDKSTEAHAAGNCWLLHMKWVHVRI
jgi:hypothetical protein